MLRPASPQILKHGTVRVGFNSLFGVIFRRSAVPCVRIYSDCPPFRRSPFRRSGF